MYILVNFNFKLINFFFQDKRDKTITENQKRTQLLEENQNQLKVRLHFLERHDHIVQDF